MQTKKALLVGAAFAAGFAITKIAKKRESDAEVTAFINEAIAKGFAEIQNARIALEKSSSVNLKIFAQRISDDYAHFNQRLMEIARAKKLPVPTIEHYEEAAKPYVIAFKNEESFNDDYVNHRLGFHTEMIKLLRTTNRSPDPLLNELMSNTLEQLDQHLRMARELSRTLHTNEIKTSSPQSDDFVEEPDYKV